MIKLEHVVLPSPGQIEFAVEGMRNSFDSWFKSDSGYCGGDKHIGCFHCYFAGSEERAKEMRKLDLQYGYGVKPCGKMDFDGSFCVGHDDYNLMLLLSKCGSDHRKFMRMLPVCVRITAPFYWWKEADTYSVGTAKNSCSTMHRIDAKEFTLDDFSTEHLLDFESGESDFPVFHGAEHSPIWLMNQTIRVLNFYRQKYLATKEKKYWWQLIQLLPDSYNQTRNVTLNYEVLANIYKARRNHKLDEWRKFCDWIETLPYSSLITGKETK